MKSLKDIKWYSTIKVKMTSLVILTMVAVSIVAGLFSYNYIKDYESNRLINYANITGDRLAKSLELPMWNIDREQVEEFVTTEMAERTLAGIAIYDEGNRGKFVAKGRAESGQVIPYDGAFSEKHIRVEREIARGGKTIGSVELYVSTQFLEAILTNFTLSAVALIVILAIAITVLMNILLIRVVVNPLAKIADTADAISMGSLDESFDIKSKDEIGYLAESFKKMQVSLRIAMDRLSMSKKESDEQRKSSFSNGQLNAFTNMIKTKKSMPSLTSIFEAASSSKTVPDDLVALAWKEWQQKNQGQHHH